MGKEPWQIELDKVLEPEGWVPPTELSSLEFLALAAEPDRPGAEVLDDLYDRAADEILAKTKAPLKSKARGPKPRKEAQKQRDRALTKRTLREVVRQALDEVYDFALDGETNVVTNRLWKRALRPALAAAFAEGVEAGADELSSCCGCSGSGLDVTNPYDQSEIPL